MAPTLDHDPAPTAQTPAGRPLVSNPFADPTVPSAPPAGFQQAREALLGRAQGWGLAVVLLFLLALLLVPPGQACPPGPAKATGASHTSHATAAPAASQPPATPTAKGQDGFFPPQRDLAAALRRARAEGKRGVALLYEMNGCGECAKLRAGTLKDAALRRDYLRDFVTVSLLADEPTSLTTFDGQPTTAAAFAQGERVFALPTLVFYDLEGVPVARQVGSAPGVEDWRALARYVRERAYEDLPYAAWRERLATTQPSAHRHTP